MNTKNQVTFSFGLGFFTSLIVGGLAGYGFGELLESKNSEVYALFTGPLGMLTYLHMFGQRTHEVATQIEMRRRK